MPRQSIRFMFFLSFVFGVVAGYGQDENPLIKRVLSNHDKNNDGEIEKSEASGLLKRNFGRFDKNKDDKLDKKEIVELGALLSKDSRQRQIPDDVEFRRDISYRKGNRAWKLDLALPKEKKEKGENADKTDSLRPAIVFIHGGGWRGGDKSGGIWTNLPIQFARRGYVCISVNYRLTKVAPFPACVEDCKCAVRWLRANAKKYRVDPNRIGAYGNSAGAHLVSMLALAGKDAKLEGDGPYQEFSSALQAVVPSATPTDFSVWAGERLGREGGLLTGDADSLKQRIKQASPVTYANAQAPPFLIFHGSTDRTVPVDQGRRLRDALEKAGAKNVTYKEYKGAGHGVFQQHRSETVPLMEKFFDKHLKHKPKDKTGNPEK